MVLFDRFVRGIKDGDILEDVEFKLLERRNGGIVTIIKNTHKKRKRNSPV
jgi:hypothetical protein